MPSRLSESLVPERVPEGQVHPELEPGEAACGEQEADAAGIWAVISSLNSSSSIMSVKHITNWRSLSSTSETGEPVSWGCW